MTNELLYALTALLFTRWIFHPRTGRMHWSRALLKANIELILLMPVFARPGIIAVVAGVMLVNLIATVLDRTMKNPSTARFVTLLITVAGLAALFGTPRLALGFNEYIVAAAALAVRENRILASVDSLALHNLFVVLSGTLLIAVEANNVILTVLHRFRVGPAASSPGIDETNEADTRELNRGRIIGILERLIIFALVMFGYIGSAGFVLAAKALARFKDLDHRDFAEYVLIGTLLSAGLALGAGVAFRAMLR